MENLAIKTELIKSFKHNILISKKLIHAFSSTMKSCFDVETTISESLLRNYNETTISIKIHERIIEVLENSNENDSEIIKYSVLKVIYDEASNLTPTTYKYIDHLHKIYLDLIKILNINIDNEWHLYDDNGVSYLSGISKEDVEFLGKKFFPNLNNGYSIKYKKTHENSRS